MSSGKQQMVSGYSHTEEDFSKSRTDVFVRTYKRLAGDF